jgi:hypothetical protein
MTSPVKECALEKKYSIFTRNITVSILSEKLKKTFRKEMLFFLSNLIIEDVTDPWEKVS